MRVDRVNVIIRYSQGSGKRAWKSIEIGAEASVDPRESWTEAQERLYVQLGQRMKVLWANSNGKSANQELPEPETTPVKNHWCAQHQQEWKKFTKEGKVWYSHRTDDGWCKE